MITSCSEKIVDQLLKYSETTFDEEQREVYVYGLVCFINTFLTVFILLVWGIVTNSLLETLLWVVVFSFLRHYAGGFHAPTQFTCIVSSSLLGMSTYFIINIISVSTYQMLSIYLFCLTVCLLWAPIDSSKLQLTLIQRKYHKIYAISIILVGYLMIHFLPMYISVSITYALVCGCCLIVLARIIK